jgi:hypothetical protein
MTRLLLLCALAASAGIHLALAGSHGPSFHVAAALLAVSAAAVALRPGRHAATAAALLLGGLLAAYALSGEQLDGLAAVTKSIEGAGLLLALALALRSGPVRRPERVVSLALAAMVAVFATAATAAVPSGAHEHPPGAPASHGH